jgi:hypothetical protein
MSDYSRTVAIVQQWAAPQVVDDTEVPLEALWTKPTAFYPNGCLDLVSRLQAEFPSTDILKLHITSIYATPGVAPGDPPGNPSGTIKSTNDLGVAVSYLLM